MISNLQIRAGRALLGWSQGRLADEAGVSVITVKRLEASDDDVQSRAGTIDKVMSALQRGGVAFPKDEGGFGHRVQLRRRD